MRWQVGTWAVGVCLVAGMSGSPVVRAAAPGRVAQAPSAAAVDPAATARYRDVLNKYCVSCHNRKTHTAGLVLEDVDLVRVAENGALWEKVARKLNKREMPPLGLPRPDAPVYQEFAAWLHGTLDRAALANPNPGRPALHRLNRTEYANAIRDLLGLEIDATLLLPADDSTHGFDNVADVLGVSPELLESYVAAARKISRIALTSGHVSPVAETYRTAPDTNQEDQVDGLPFGTRGGLAARHLFPADGEYEIKVRLTRGVLDQIRGLQEPHTIELALDGQRLDVFPLDGGRHMYEERYYNADTPSLLADQRLKVRIPVKAGVHDVYATFLVKSSAIGEDIVQGRVYGPANGNKGLPQVEGITITGPYGAKLSQGAPGRRILVCKPGPSRPEATCARQIIRAFARRAYRGQPVDMPALMRVYEQGRAAGGFEAGIEMAVWRVLASPQFIFRFEQDPKTGPAGPHRLSDVELASRISFFLWSSIPDERLLGAAARGELRTPVVLEREVRRMLADPKSVALVQNFARQWLSLQKLQNARPDPGRFPEFDDALRQSLSRETELLFEHVMRQDASVLELVKADYSFINERLARHYGIPGVLGSQFRKVPMPENRRGLLGHASVLTVASFPTRTSPVLRGKWLLDALLGSPPPPPPPNVPALSDKDKDTSGKVLTMRERMTEHRRNPVCANCHSRMDPIGLALESFDAVGAWRSEKLDTTGSLPDGTKFDGVSGLRDAILSRPTTFAGALAEKLFIYALGRGLESYDAPAVRTVIADASAKDYRFSALVLGIIRSVPFQMRVPAAPDTPATVAMAPTR